jgi:transcriptional regulator GlxA family with amidase domain
MESNLEKPLAREDLARLAGLSVRQLERIFRAQLSRGIHEHYLSLRLNRARQLLRETSLSVLDVAMTMGFASASQFSRSFRAAFDHSPRDTATRARHRAGT